MKKRILASILSLCFLISTSPTFAAIKNLEVNQGLSYYMDKSSGKISLIETFVAEKNTVILVEVDEEIEIDPQTQMVEIIKDGVVITTLLPNGKGKTTLLEFLPKGINEVKGWTSGTYEIKATIGEWTATRTVEFKNTEPLNILVVPVKANYGGAIKSCNGLYKTARTFLEQTYPVAEKNINWVVGKEIDLSSAEYDLITDDGQYAVWDAARNLQAKGKDGKDTYDLILAFVPDRQGAESNLQGYTFGKPANIITESDEDMQATVAHEIAHCYKIGDEYAGGSFNPIVNDPPLGMTGRDFNTGEGNIVGKNPIFVSDESLGEGSVIDNQLRPYEFGGRGIIKTNTISYMGSGGAQANYWTTPIIYEYLYNEFLSKAPEITNPAENIRLVEIYGVINKDGRVETDPLYTFSGNKTDVENVGTYTFAALDANGKILSSNRFEASFYNPSMNETLEYASFGFYGEFPEGTTSFAIMQGEKVMHKIMVSANAPTGAFTVNPKTFTGEQTFKWEASDADGDKVVAQILYSPDGEELYVLEYDYTEKEITLDFDGLEGNKNAYLWICLSDGVNSYNVFSNEQSTEVEESKPSDWAVNEINAAIEAGITFDEILDKYQQNITREEFCKLVVTLYAATGGEISADVPASPFADTNTKEVIVANALGIVKGVSKTEFAPYADITREQIATMMNRMMDLVVETEGSNDLSKYSDYNQISPWAMESLSFLNQLEIIKGVSDTEIAPKNNTTREQAILISYRVLKALVEN